MVGAVLRGGPAQKRASRTAADIMHRVRNASWGRNPRRCWLQGRRVLPLQGRYRYRHAYVKLLPQRGGEQIDLPIY